MRRIFLFALSQNACMAATKKIRKLLIAFICLALFILVSAGVPAYAETDDEYYLGGFPAGFILNTQNVEVIGLCEVETQKGTVCPARDGGIMSGDIIKNINGIAITSVSQLTATLNEDFSVYNFEIQRGDQQVKTQVLPVKDRRNDKKQFGMLVRDSLNGIGTITYINKNDKTFGSLGHPVMDATGNLIQINGGSLYGCSIYDVKRGLRGNPGELKGLFDNGVMLGAISKNTQCGIFGKLTKDYDYSQLKAVKIADASKVEMGKAYIYSTLSGKSCEEYEISIVKVEENNKENKNFVIKINDKRLLDRAGGIVQGMSGSPIVQNGKLIGAVTHVFVNDPTRGYGIAIENMINS